MQGSVTAVLNNVDSKCVLWGHYLESDLAVGVCSLIPPVELPELEIQVVRNKTKVVLLECCLALFRY